MQNNASQKDQIKIMFNKGNLYDYYFVQGSNDHVRDALESLVLRNLVFEYHC